MNVEVEMTGSTCRFCLAPLEPEHVQSGLCDGCWYGMRLEPEQWCERLESIGRPVREVNGFWEPCDNNEPLVDASGGRMMLCEHARLKCDECGIDHR